MTGSIYKAYDIRGIYPTELNEDIAYRVGRALVLFLDKTNPRVAVGRDARLSSPALAEALIRGITDQGGTVIDIGLAATPTLYFAVAHHGYDAGVEVTASHNPKEYNGLKIVRERAISIGLENGLVQIREIAERNKFPPTVHGGIIHTDLTREHVEHDMKFAGKVDGFTIAADPANAMGVLYIEELFHHVPGNLVRMNFKLDGTFPAHQADPLQDETLADLKKKVVESGADLGIATDGDGDRIFFIDEKGETVPQPIIRGVMAQMFLRRFPGATICYDIRPGKITHEMIVAGGGVPVKTRVGHTFIKQKMRETGAVFAGESSGHFFTNINGACYETPTIVILKLLEWMTEQKKPLSELVAQYKKYWNSGEINFVVQEKDAAIQKITEHFAGATVDLLDGLTIETNDFWFNLRKSNTEPLLRLNLEAVNKEIGEEKVREINSILGLS